jgi:hypothetical protein
VTTISCMSATIIVLITERNIRIWLYAECQYKNIKFTQHVDFLDTSHIKQFFFDKCKFNFSF